MNATKPNVTNISSVKSPVMSQQVPEQGQKTPAGYLILQWLTYAFWGWLILALGAFAHMVLEFLLPTSTSTNFAGMPYATSIVVVLSLVAIGCEIFYRRKEPAVKKGFATALMIIHAVIFALFGIGALIITLFLLINWLTAANAPINDFLVGVMTAIFFVALYSAAFIRTLAPKNPRKWSLAFLVFMSASIGLTLLLAIFGPITSAITSKQDHSVSQAMHDITTSIDRVAYDMGTPDSLEDVDFGSRYDKEGAAENKAIVDKDLLTYEKKSEKSFEICGNFTTKQTANDRRYDTRVKGNTVERINFGQHDRGHVCWTVQTGAPRGVFD